MPRPRQSLARHRPTVTGLDPALGSRAFRQQVDRGWRSFFARRGIAVGSHTFSRTTLCATRALA
jgi:hypothetical protein